MKSGHSKKRLTPSAHNIPPGKSSGARVAGAAPQGHVGERAAPAQKNTTAGQGRAGSEPMAWCKGSAPCARRAGRMSVHRPACRMWGWHHTKQSTASPQHLCQQQILYMHSLLSHCISKPLVHCSPQPTVDAGACHAARQTRQPPGKRCRPAANPHNTLNKTKAAVDVL